MGVSHFLLPGLLLVLDLLYSDGHFNPSWHSPMVLQPIPNGSHHFQLLSFGVTTYYSLAHLLTQLSSELVDATA